MPKGDVDWDDFKRIATGMWNVAPSEFRAMTPKEFWLIYDGKKRQQDAARGRMTREEYEQMKRDMEARGIDV